MITPPTSTTWRAIAGEATIASSHLALGATSLSDANLGLFQNYGQAFFALSVGIERSCKLAVVTSQYIKSGGTLPTSGATRSSGHRLNRLIDDLRAVANDNGVPWTLPIVPEPIHDGIISVLTDFANNITRYYNLDLLTTGARSSLDAIGSWHMNVTIPVMRKHYTLRRHMADHTYAENYANILGRFSIFNFQNEVGNWLQDPYQVAMHLRQSDFARPLERMYVLRIAGQIYSVMRVLGNEAAKRNLPDVPLLGEFFAIFGNDDAYFRTRKTWKI